MSAAVRNVMMSYSCLCSNKYTFYRNEIVKYPRILHGGNTQYLSLFMLSLFELKSCDQRLERVALIYLFKPDSMKNPFSKFSFCSKSRIKIEFRELRPIKIESVRSMFVVPDEPTSHLFTLFCHRTSEFDWMEGKRTKYSSLVGATKYTEIHTHFRAQRGKSQKPNRHKI